MMFAIVMKVNGLMIAYQKSGRIHRIPSCLWQHITIHVSLGLFAITSLIYIAKLIKYPKAVMNEWKHPVRINFFSAISISMLMLAIITRHDFHTMGATFWYIGTAMHMFMTLYTITFWIKHNQEIGHTPIRHMVYPYHWTQILQLLMGIHLPPRDVFSMYLAYTMMGVTTLMMLVVLYQTIKHMFMREICIQE